VLPGYTEADVDARVLAYAATGGVPGLGNDDVDLTDVTVTLAGSPGLPCKRVVVTFTHTFMFLGGIGTLFGTTYGTVPLTAAAEMRTEQP